MYTLDAPIQPALIGPHWGSADEDMYASGPTPVGVFLQQPNPLFFAAWGLRTS